MTNKLTINYESAALVPFRLKKWSFSFFLELLVLRLSRTVKGISFQIVFCLQKWPSGAILIHEATIFELKCKALWAEDMLQLLDWPVRWLVWAKCHTVLLSVVTAKRKKKTILLLAFIASLKSQNYTVRGWMPSKEPLYRKILAFVQNISSVPASMNCMWWNFSWWDQVNKESAETRRDPDNLSALTSKTWSTFKCKMSREATTSGGKYSIIFRASLWCSVSLTL